MTATEMDSIPELRQQFNVQHHLLLSVIEAFMTRWSFLSTTLEDTQKKQFIKIGFMKLHRSCIRLRSQPTLLDSMLETEMLVKSARRVILYLHEVYLTLF